LKIEDHPGWVSSTLARTRALRPTAGCPSIIGQHRPTVTPELPSARLGRGKCRFGTAGDQSRLKLRNARHLLKHEPTSWSLNCRKVGKAHVNTCL
jgi:hypothetical protein